MRPAPAGRLLPLALALSLAGCAGHRPPPSARAARPPAAEAALQLATFEQAWSRIAETYPHADFRGLDWKAVHDELLPRARAARTAAELRPVLQELVGRLGESHFGVMPGSRRPRRASPERPAATAPPAAPAERSLVGGAGFDVRQVGEEFLVTRVDAGGPAEAAGVKPGWALLAAAQLHVVDLLGPESRDRGAAQEAWSAISAMLHGSPGTPVRVSFRDEADAVVTLDIVRAKPEGIVTHFGNLPDLVAQVESRTVAGDVGYVRFNLFLIPVVVPVTQAIDGFVRDGARGIVIDLRGNPGGIGAMVMGMAGHFIHEPGKSLGQMTTREATLEFTAVPKAEAERFHGPVAVLVDEMTLSTAEMLAGGLQQLGRARVFGRRTGGMALPSIVEELPNGDRLQFAIADLTGPGGMRIEGQGVAPDVEVPLRREDLLAGRDADLEAALEWIGSAAQANVAGP